MLSAKGIKMITLNAKYAVAKTTSVQSSITSKICTVLTDPTYTNPVFVAKTPDEFSIIMPSSTFSNLDFPPQELTLDDNWTCFKVIGPMPFDLVGIMAKLSKILADSSISLLAQSTFDTDYILVKEENKDAAISAFVAAGVEFMS